MRRSEVVTPPVAPRTPEAAVGAVAPTSGRVAPPAARPGGGRGKGRRRQPSGLPWILPAIVLVVGLVYFGIGYTGYVSTLDWNGFILSAPEHVGSANFVAMFQDPVFFTALRHTAVFF